MKEIRIKSLAKKSELVNNINIESVKLLGDKKKVEWKQTDRELKALLPGKSLVKCFALLRKIK